MKKQLFGILVLGLLFSCSSGPQKAAQNFTENIAKGKIDEAKKFATEGTAKLLDLAKAFGGIPIEPDFEFNFLRDSVVKKRAWVFYKNDKGNEDVVELVKIDGDWLVYMNANK